MKSEWLSWGGRFLAALCLVLIARLSLLGVLEPSARLRLDIGPGDGDYVQGLSERWRYDGVATWREVGRRAILRLPVTLEGPGTLSLAVAQPNPTSSLLEVRFDDDTLREIGIAPTEAFQEVAVELPRERLRAFIRLRCENQAGTSGCLRIDAVSWRGRSLRPQAQLVWDATLLLAVSFAALAVAGASTRVSLAAALVLGACFIAWAHFDAFASIHLIQKSALVSWLGLAVVGLGRLLGRGLTPSFLSLVYATLLLKSSLLFHPSFYFYDLEIHQTLLEYVYHRGLFDFWWHLPDYQKIHGTGMTPVAGQYHAYPYPVAFHVLVHFGNRIAHDPVFWLKAGGGLVSALALFPLGYLARRLSQEPRADLLAGIAYVLTPAYIRSLFLLELSALTGHVFELLAVSYLMKIDLELDRPRRLLFTSLLIGASLGVYPSGFVHLGLLMGCLLALAPLLGGLSAQAAFRLAGVSLAGAVLGVLCYNPRSLANLFLVILPAGIGSASGAPPLLTELASSAWGRATTFLGAPLLFMGVASLAVVLRSLRSRRSRLLLAAWAASAALAYAFRFYFAELFLKQKELYWAGALLAVTLGSAAAPLLRRSRAGVAVAVIAVLLLAAAGLKEFLVMVPRFYRDYLFL